MISTVHIKDLLLCCAHWLPNVPVGHPCGRAHGHNYLVSLAITGPVVDPFGWVIDYAEVKELWANAVHRVLDHQSLNDTLENPTCELLAAWIHCEMVKVLPFGTQLEVYVEEEPGCGVSYPVRQ